MPKDADGLTPKQERFCREYLIDHNATQSAIRAGYSPRSAGNEGPRLIGNDGVWKRIQELENQALRRLQASADKVLAEWTNLGFADPAQLVWRAGERDSTGSDTIAGSVKPLHEMPPEVRRTIKSIKFDEQGRPEIVLFSKDTSLTNLGKFHKLIVERHEHKIEVSFSERLRRAREKRLAKLKRK